MDDAESHRTEVLQLAIATVLGFTYKLGDVDDVTLNIAGVAAGYVVSMLPSLAFEDEVIPSERSVGGSPA